MFKNVKDSAEETLTDGEIEKKLIKILLKFLSSDELGANAHTSMHTRACKHTSIQVYTSTQAHKHTNKQTRLIPAS